MRILEHYDFVFVTSCLIAFRHRFGFSKKQIMWDRSRAESVPVFCWQQMVVGVKGCKCTFILLTGQDSTGLYRVMGSVVSARTNRNIKLWTASKLFLTTHSSAICSLFTETVCLIKNRWLVAKWGIFSHHPAPYCPPVPSDSAGPRWTSCCLSETPRAWTHGASTAVKFP